MYLPPDWKQFLLKIDLQGRLHEYCKWLKILPNFQFSSFWREKKKKLKNGEKIYRLKMTFQNEEAKKGRKKDE